MATTTDIKIASIAAGFTLGFGFLTVWEAIKQTHRNRNPLRSTYIYMLWGEIVANLCIAVIGWLFLDGVISSTLPTLFFMLFFWVFEVQLLLQIIINRIAIIAEHKSTIRSLKWGTAAFITCINVVVFCIWIPAHLEPPLSPLIVRVNEYWDRISKVLIMLVDAVLNWYFLRTVKKRLLDQHNLKKYEPLVGFTVKIMVVSIAMDAMLIGLISMQNQVVFIQFHPVVYMVKLNIEMSMARLITRLARSPNANEYYPSMPNSHRRAIGNFARTDSAAWTRGNGLQLTNRSSVVATGSVEDLATSLGALGAETGIHRRTDIEIKVEEDTRGFGRGELEDELPLTSDTGPPNKDAK